MKTVSTSIKKVIIISGGVGLIAGVLISYILFPRIITKSETIESEKLITDTIFVEKDKIIIREVEKRIVIKDTVRLESKEDSTHTDTISDSLPSILISDNPTDSLLDTLQTSPLVDTNNSPSINDNAYSYVKSNGNDIRVSANELIYTTRLTPEGDASLFYCNTNNDLDSLLMDNHTETTHDGTIRVEYWASPLNAIGYRLNRNSLVLFGFYEYKHLKLRYLNNGLLQMSYFDNEYVLKCGDEFRSLIIKNSNEK